MASLVAIFLIESVGRRKLMFFGSVGQTITMILLAVLGSINNSASRIISAILLFVFNSFFAVGWLGMTWLYVSDTNTPALSASLFDGKYSQLRLWVYE